VSNIDEPDSPTEVDMTKAAHEAASVRHTPAHRESCFIVKDAKGQALGYFYFEDKAAAADVDGPLEPGRGAADSGQKPFCSRRPRRDAREPNTLFASGYRESKTGGIETPATVPKSPRV
jgi:hypothetical protein